MITGNQICLGPIGAAGALNYYVQVPIACQIGTVRVTCQAEGLASEATVTVKNSDGNTIGVSTFDTTPTAGEKATYAANATYGNDDLAINEVLTIATSAFGGASDRVFVQIELDPYALD